MPLKSEFKFEVIEKGGNLIVSVPSGKFKAVYYKAVGQPQLILRERTTTDDHELIADAWKAANKQGARVRVDRIGVAA